MSLNRPEAIGFLKKFDFKGLFRETLGWNRADDTRSLAYNGQKFTFEAFAQQAGVTAYACRVDDVSQLGYQTRNQIERAAAPNFPSHLFVFFDDEWMVWQWSRRELGQPRQIRGVGPFHRSSSFEPIIQKLDVLKYDIDNGNVQATDVDQRLKEAFNVEPVTKAFYKEFEKQYEAFLQAITGIAAEYECEFASLMLNRLMFLYFIQSKGFFPKVDVKGLKPTDYLFGKFKDKTARANGKSDYLHGFLAPLFFEILSVKRDDRKTAHIKIFGDLIYLNGGLFSQRDWEKSSKIAIPDAAFEKIFSFFGAWNWQLDERPTQAGNEINPDVLGYVFEKFINQKQMGAYYTKEDITGYISKNTILPRLFEMSGLNPARPLELLSNNIERYIYPAVKHGCELPLPAAIEATIADIPKRDGWNKTATSDLGLPTETWREVVARRARFESLAGPNASATFTSVSDLITHNLDISQWFVDVIADISEPGELEKLWKALEEISILDPTVGSGAFLFAAMGVLQPVYSACLERMDGFTSEADARASKQKFKAAPSFDTFRAALREIESHPNRLYAIYKKLTVQNLYGTDIMPEATEICKLRLFLKLAAQVSPDTSKPNLGIEPLPDIDFNIRAGNTLVGFATESEAYRASVEQMALGINWEDVTHEMRAYGSELDKFRDMQKRDETYKASDKDALNKQHEALVEKLNLFNAGLYIDEVEPKSAPYAKWKASHQPFHWCAEFYSVIKSGGFDVIIGNPPYVEYPSDKVKYTVRDYETLSCGNLYAMACERALKLLKKDEANGGRLGFIIPVASICTDGYIPLQNQLRRAGDLFVSNYNDRPGRLFDGLEHIRLSIVLSVNNRGGRVFASCYNKWNTEAREFLFPCLSLANVKDFIVDGIIPKLPSDLEQDIYSRLLREIKTIEHYQSRVGSYSIHYTRKLSGFVQILGFVPKIYDDNNVLRQPSELKEIKIINQDAAKIYLAALNSSLFFWFLTTRSDCRNLNKREVFAMPINIECMDQKLKNQLVKLADDLNNDLQKNAVMLTSNYKKHGTMTIESIYPKKSKSIIDEIDRVLAAHYGFTEEETDFIINYDIKYRMGRDAGEE